MRPLVALLAAALLSGCVSPALEGGGPALPATPPTFRVEAHPFDDGRMGGEPSLAVAPDGTLYVCAPSGVLSFATNPTGPNAPHRSSHLWRSDDADKTWTWLDPNPVPGLPVHVRSAAPGGGDCDVAVNERGTLFLVDLTGAGVSIAVSRDRGESWGWTLPLVGAPVDDRQWVATAGASDVYVVFHEVGTGLWVAHSADEGRTFPDQWLVARNRLDRDCACPPSNIAVSPDGSRIAVAWSDGGEEVGLALSTDGGRTWSVRQAIPIAEPPLGPMVGLAFDGQMAPVVTWVDGTQVRIGVSRDDGATWSVANVTQGANAALPWVSVRGNLTLVTYAVQEGAEWFVRMALGSGPLHDATPFEEVEVSAEPALRGPLSRPLADFFENAFDADGRPSVVWASDVDGAGGRMWFGQGQWDA